MKISLKTELSLSVYNIEYEEKNYIMSVEKDLTHNLTRLFLEDEEGNSIEDFLLVDKFHQEIKEQSSPYTT